MGQTTNLAVHGAVETDSVSRESASQASVDPSAMLPHALPAEPVMIRPHWFRGFAADVAIGAVLAAATVFLAHVPSLLWIVSIPMCAATVCVWSRALSQLTCVFERIVLSPDGFRLSYAWSSSSSGWPNIEAVDSQQNTVGIHVRRIEQVVTVGPRGVRGLVQRIMQIPRYLFFVLAALIFLNARLILYVTTRDGHAILRLNRCLAGVDLLLTRAQIDRPPREFAALLERYAISFGNPARIQNLESINAKITAEHPPLADHPPPTRILPRGFSRPRVLLAIAVCGVGMLADDALAMLLNHRTVLPISVKLGMAAFMAIWALAALRLAASEWSLSSDGLGIIGSISQWTIPWSDIERFEIQKHTLMGARAVIYVRETAVQRTSGRTSSFIHVRARRGGRVLNVRNRSLDRPAEDFVALGNAFIRHYGSVESSTGPEQLAPGSN
jgi:hypothetical protein